MPRYILYFTEYSYKTDEGLEISPYIENSTWVLDRKIRTLKEIVDLCNLDEQEHSMLILKYGIL